MTTEQAEQPRRPTHLLLLESFVATYTVSETAHYVPTPYFQYRKEEHKSAHILADQATLTIRQFAFETLIRSKIPPKDLIIMINQLRSLRLELANVNLDQIPRSQLQNLLDNLSKRLENLGIQC